MDMPSRKRLAIVMAVAMIAVACVVACVAVSVGLGIGLGSGSRRQETQPAAPYFQHAAVAADAAVCSQVGADILKKNGSAVDAAIASLFCVGVVNLHSTGIGGGGFMVYYNATSGKSTFIDYREVAPLKSTVHMFDNASSLRGTIAHIFKHVLYCNYNTVYTRASDTSVLVWMLRYSIKSVLYLIFCSNARMVKVVIVQLLHCYGGGPG